MGKGGGLEASVEGFRVSIGDPGDRGSPSCATSYQALDMNANRVYKDNARILAFERATGRIEGEELTVRHLVTGP